jgi:integrase
MSTIKAILRKDQPDKNGMCTISLLVREGASTAIKYSIGEKVLPSQFDEIQQVVIKHSRKDEINHLISLRKIEVENIIFDLKRNGVKISLDRIKAGLKNNRKRLNDESVLDLSTPILEDGKMTVQSAFKSFMIMRKPTVKKSAMTAMNTMFKHLKNYCVQHNKKLTWELFDLDFHTYWLIYFTEECENEYGDIGFSNNYIGKLFKDLKVFLRWSYIRKYNPSADFMMYKVYNEEIDIFPLTESHLARIVNFCDDPINELRLRKVGSLFVFLATTGMRFSDGQNLKWHDLYYNGIGDLNDQVIRFTTQKTNKKISIPLDGYALKEIVRNAFEFEKGKLLIHKILNPQNTAFDNGDLYKYFNNEDELKEPLLPKISNVKFNLYIKEVAQLCGFDEIITTKRKSGINEQLKTFKRWEKISSHDCRRTFITLSLKKGMRPETVMTFTGHTSIKTMMKYNKIDEKTKYDEYREKWGESIFVYDDWLGTAKLTVGTRTNK